MGIQNITVGKLSVAVPDNYDMVESMPGDPKNSVPVVCSTAHSACFVIMLPIPEEKSMPLNDTQAMIDGIRPFLELNQGLVEVESGKTAANKTFMYSIIKSRNLEGGILYTLTCNLEAENELVMLQGFFEEVGEVGQRASVVMQDAKAKGLISEDQEGWASDPYDAKYIAGELKNLSEDYAYDKQFPEHPLSMLHAFIETFISNN